MTDYQMRKVVSVAGLSHGTQPIPMAVLIGNLVFTGGINGKAPHATAPPHDLVDEVAQVFNNLKAILTAAGAGPQHVAKITIFAGDRSVRDLVNAEWLAMFPDPADRPVRHTQIQPLTGVRLQLDCIAVLGPPEPDMGLEPEQPTRPSLSPTTEHVNKQEQST